MKTPAILTVVLVLACTVHSVPAQSTLLLFGLDPCLVRELRIHGDAKDLAPFLLELI